MVVTIHPCFHWIGFHITSSLLQEGMEVVGIDPISDRKKDLLYMFVGRNSNFQHFYNIEDKENHIQRTKGEWEIEIWEEGLLVKGENYEEEWIEFPLLYGEWMDLHPTESEDQSDLKRWILDKEAVYIGDFLEDFLTSLFNQETFNRRERKLEEETLNERIKSLWCCDQMLKKV
ncbi:hypothetical protein SAMN05192559_106178 [Halobacillus karajensis]|uniref:Uncharacterized protein n=1 Tax=Halobacillus karajensis TaxID=195088 RepID=A0A024P7S6_9BACI|nr:hypothetical protein [Halobacillus karajensis]CDQ21038.1 hypothetical protein BN982_03401 [Halobacillus karajensis]CDQ24898.1 hypothetical protein BN983_03197 [Halobacillus karajensis]CDQ28742.1 hypothetical protein BN981_03057 [Halobacillus karajensis]SEH97110.1 hypothetical protein SAMN05192559_106178 [Halobacillus karajensis]